MASPTRSYPYRARWSTVIGVGGFFGLCAVVLGVKAAANERALIINGLIELGPEGASRFYGALCVLSAGFVLAAGALAVSRLRGDERALRVSPTFVEVPGRGGAVTRVLFAAMKASRVRRVSGQRILEIDHDGGRTAVAASLLPDDATFDDVVAQIETGFRRAKGAR